MNQVNVNPGTNVKFKSSVQQYTAMLLLHVCLAATVFQVILETSQIKTAVCDMKRSYKYQTGYMKYKVESKIIHKRKGKTNRLTQSVTYALHTTQPATVQQTA